ncbi:MAG: RsfA family transcriptional regulator [Paenibacillaceae bacterium]|jgi:prespore-specific regulator|nr:RsfA family transcriptional regulator [Paenibacillaceae bacterium]
MSAVRQDAWSEEDDLILAEVTLRHIREGGTQLAAFEEVGERIGRTAAACGFRWNSFVRKKYEAAIQIAKAQRQKRSQLKKHTGGAAMATVAMVELQDPVYSKTDGFSEESLSVDAVIRYLRQWKTTYSDMSRQIRNMEKELSEAKERIDSLRQENTKLNSAVTEAASDYRVVNDDYKALIQIMDRARKLSLLQEEDEENRARFKMDANGNLERID